jgi:murein L,D-transpeptidase YafK
LNRSPPFRLLLASAAIAAAGALGGCQTDGTDLSARAMTPLSSKTLAELEQKNMSKDSSILIRIFKQDAELEVWKQDRTGRYALLKTYPVCRWSGELGPKIKEGDRQAPEGFYSITPSQMNPKSQYYLAFNMGYPNAYDRSWNRTGAELMIHGDCSSRGCYAMTDEQIGEIYALGREAFFGGQRAFQVQAYPFRMTPENLAKHRNNPNLAFWKMLKRGNDHFEVTRLEPKVDVCEKRYVFDAQAPANSSPLSFNPVAKCPAYEVSSDIVAAVNEKQRQDEFQTAELITRGTKTSPIRTGTDGGMHPVFLAALQKTETGASDSPLRTLATITTPIPGTIPQSVVPPRAPQTVAVAPIVSAPATVPQRLPPPAPARMATAIERPAPVASSRPANGSLFSNIYAPAAAPANARAAASPSETTGALTTARVVPAAKPHIVARPAQTTAPGAIRPKQTETVEQSSRPAEGERPSNAASLVANTAPSTAPMAPAGNFESRWSSITTRGRF